MTNLELIESTRQYAASCSLNYVPAQDAIYPELAGLKIFEEPIFGFAAADDLIFTETFKRTGVIHPDYKAPKEWLGSAVTVISFFLPFTRAIKDSNLLLVDEPYEPGLPQACSAAWLHGRIEGQKFLNTVTDHIQKILEAEGYETFCPTTSGQHKMLAPYISNWSERHAAYAAGLGTFGLSKGLITEKGMAGRFGSVITNAPFEITKRPYSDPFEYCIMCGACAPKCPIDAIDVTKGCALGKDQDICGPYQEATHLPPHGPNQIARYGCGKCQVGVPCESRIPKRK